MKDRVFEIARNPKYEGSKFFVQNNLEQHQAQELHKTLVKNSKIKDSMQDLKIKFGQQIQVKGDHCLLKIKVLNIYYMW